MKWVTSHAGQLHVRSVADEPSSASPRDVALAAGAVHELLFDARQMPAPPAWLALVWARDAIARRPDGPLVWCDADRTFYPPAARLGGVPLSRLCVVRPAPADVTWTVAECLRCPGVAGVVATVPTQMNRVEVRRLQLAVEAGGGVGVLMRPRGRGDDVYAAATRWLIAPAPTSERATQRWRVEFLHGHGGSNGGPLSQPFYVESRRARVDELRRVPDASDAVPVRRDADVAAGAARAATA